MPNYDRGYEVEPYGNVPDTRATHTDRDGAINQLHAAEIRGQLTPEHAADRMEAASKAVTRKDLARLTADVPGPTRRKPTTRRAHNKRVLVRAFTACAFFLILAIAPVSTAMMDQWHGAGVVLMTVVTMVAGVIGLIGSVAYSVESYDEG